MRALPHLVAFGLVSLIANASDAIAPTPNLLPNPDFDAGIASWIGGGVQAKWAQGFDEDGDESPTAGSLRIDVNGEAGAVRDVRACVPIIGGAPHIFGTQYFIPFLPIPMGQARVIVSWYDEPDCVGFMESHGILPDQAADVVGAWTGLARVATPPVNADSAALVLGGWKLVGQENQPDFVIYFDDAVLVPELDGALAMSVALTTLAAVRLRTTAQLRRD